MDIQTKMRVCAQAAHEVNRAWCEAHGDRSQSSWEAAPDWQKRSAMLGVDGVLAGNGPRESHEGWLKVKRMEGWKWGAVKDPAKKEHPCFMAYDELPPEQQAKDHLFVSTVGLMAKALGLME